MNPQDTHDELYQTVIEALEAAYPHLSVKQLGALLYVCGISPKEAFPWHSESSGNPDAIRKAA